MSALLPALAAIILVNLGGPMGLPSFCCGQANCGYAKVSLIERGKEFSAVKVDGQPLRVPSGRVYPARRGVYCWNEALDGCEGVVSAECAQCVGVATGSVRR